MDYRDEAPDIIKGFLTYHETIKAHSRATVDEYYLDLRNFFRFLKIERGILPRSTELDDISIKDIDLDFVKSVTLTEFYDYLSFHRHKDNHKDIYLEDFFIPNTSHLTTGICLRTS